MQVTKRNGKKEQFDISKIKRSIEFACEKAEANPLELESMVNQFLKQGVTTEAIQKNIIQQAIQLATPSSPEWLQVAGNAYAMDCWNSYKHKDKSFLEVVYHCVEHNVFDATLLLDYSDEDIAELGNHIDNNRDLEHSYSSLFTATNKYLNENESNQIAHMVNAMRFGQCEDEVNRLLFVKQVYDVLSKREFSLATPFMLNLRKGGNTASCFIIALEDDLDSIFTNVHRIAKISKNGGGIGIFLGYLRAKGSTVNGAKNAAGPVAQWVKIINDTLVAVNQGGKRAGAGTVALPIWHNDIQGFLDIQTEHGDIRLKSYDVFPQVTVPDIFMQRDKAEQQWVTFCPYEVKQKLGIDVRGLYNEAFTEAYLKIEQAAMSGKLEVFSIIPSARTLTKLIMRTQFETGLPYLFFVDTANKTNPNIDDKDAYGIVCSNLCCESYSNVKPDLYGHVCNLGSVNLANIHSMERLAEVSRIACRILNRGMELTNNPDDITENHNKRYSTIGIGIMGLHDYLAKEYLNFGSLDVIAEIAECIEYNAALESVELAKTSGRFTAFEFSKWKNGEMTELFGSKGCGKYDWKYLQSQIDKYGMRNSQLTSPAPTTTTSIYQDSSASIQPVFKAFFAEDNKSGTVKVSSKYLKQNPLGYGKTQPKFSAKEVIDVVATVQQFTDTGISMEIMFDQNKPDFKAKDLYDAIHYAHEKKIKSIYYIRTIKKNENIVQKEDDCVSCSG